MHLQTLNAVANKLVNAYNNKDKNNIQERFLFIYKMIVIGNKIIPPEIASHYSWNFVC